MIESPDTTVLVEEYETLVAEIGGTVDHNSSQRQLDRIRQSLITHADWTPEAANHLLHLATNYGAFMLRNACALAIAMKVEDGDLGF
jgi:hypothetical protein